VLDILVENNGRINYGPFLTDNRKGITDKVTLNGQELLGWKMYQFPFTTTAGFRYLPTQIVSSEAKIEAGWHTTIYPPDTAPALYRGTFSLRTTGDTYLDMKDFGKGFAFVNGHNLGKYWNVGPTQTLFVPAVWLKKGTNEVVIFDQLNGGHQEIGTLDHPLLSELNPPVTAEKK
jgi:beta-galactosidase